MGKYKHLSIISIFSANFQTEKYRWSWYRQFAIAKSKAINSGFAEAFFLSRPAYEGFFSRNLGNRDIDRVAWISRTVQGIIAFFPPSVYRSCLLFGNTAERNWAMYRDRMRFPCQALLPFFWTYAEILVELHRKMNSQPSNNNLHAITIP